MTWFFAVASPPRSGTKWYSQLFTHEDVFCYHELSLLFAPFPEDLALKAKLREAMDDHDFEQGQRRHYLDGYPRYFSRLWESAAEGRRVVGNSDSKLASFSCGVWLLWPETRFVFSTRNGINKVNSTFVDEPNVGSLALAARSSELEPLPPFEISCRRWVGEIGHLSAQREWLEERGARCVSTTLESLTTDVGELERVWSFVAGDWERHAEWAVARMGEPVNARVNLEGVIRGPDDVWAAWSDEQRAAFTEICGETQVGLGYELPPR